MSRSLPGWANAMAASCGRTVGALVTALLLTGLLITLPAAPGHCAQPAAATPAVPVPASDEFHFVVLGDSQFHKPIIFNRIIDQVALLRPAFVVQVGDMINGYTSDLQAIRAEWRRFRAQVAPLAPISFMPVPGNHDLYGAQRAADPALEAIYREQWGETFYSFRYRNALAIVLNTDGVASERSLDELQWRWLRETLAGNDADHVFVFMHRPPDSIDGSEALHALFREYPVRIVFYGHHHHYHFAERDGIRYVMTNAAANSALAVERVGGFNHFLQVTVRDAEISMGVIREGGVRSPEFVHPTDNYDLFEISRKLAPAEVALTPAGEDYAFDIPLTNPTQRDLQLFVTCSSADGRWTFDPSRIAPVELASGASHLLQMTLSYAANRKPESLPECQLQLPFQKTSGAWLTHQQSVAGTLTEKGGR